VAWVGAGKKILKKNSINQQREDLELWNSLSIFIRYSYYIYTVLRSVLMLKSGLEFEREYSAVVEGYRYVYYFSYKGINKKFVYKFQCTIRGLELELDDIQPTL